MSVSTRAEPAAHARRRMSRPYLAAATIRRLALASALLLTGCAAPPPAPLAAPDPADPGAPAPRVGYRSTIAPYVSERPVDPGPWREQNERVAPEPRS